MITVLRHHPAGMRPFASACRVATGRSALFHLANIVKPSAVVMPCYVPEGVIDPFINAGIPVAHYRLLPDLTPDYSELRERMWAFGKRPMFVVIHYFGIPAPVAPMRSTADEVGGILVEDCAHALIGDAARAPLADVVLYSLNKFLPVSDGAILASRRTDIDVTLDEATLPELPLSALYAYDNHLRFTGEFCNTGTDAALARAEAAYDRYYAEVSHLMTPCRQSARSRAVEAAADLAAMEVERRHAARSLRDSIIPKFRVSATAEPLFAYPIRCYGQADAITDNMAAAGIMPARMTDLWNHIPETGFDFERRFLDDHLLLPVSGVGPDEVSVMASVLRGFA